MSELADWQPIKTAPFTMDNSTGLRWLKWCLLFVPDEYGGYEIIGDMEGGEWLWRDDERCCAPLLTPPTHWMPLPEAPK